MAYRKFSIQLKDGLTGAAIISSGGVCHVAQNGSPDKQTIYSDAQGTAASNPVALTRGKLEFYTLDTVASVDLYIQAPGGQFVIVTGVVSSGPNEIAVNTSKKEQIYKIPFSIADATAATEKDTGFDLPSQCQVLSRLSGMGVQVTTADSGQNILFGLLSTESGGDADGLSTNVSLASAILKTGVAGALYSTNAPHLSDSVTAKSLSYTLDASTDTGKGFIILPVVLA